MAKVKLEYQKIHNKDNIHDMGKPPKNYKEKICNQTEKGQKI